MRKSLEGILRRIVTNSGSTGSSKRAREELALLSDIASLKELCKVAQTPRQKQELRSAACWALGRLADSRAVPTLLELVKTASPLVTWESAKSLVILTKESSGATRELTATLTNGRRSHNRSAAAYVLGFTGKRESISPLIKLLKSADSPKVRSHAAEALGHLKATRATKALIAALQDTAAEVRFSAVHSLSEMGDDRAIPELKKLANVTYIRSSEIASIREDVDKAITSIRRRSRGV